LTFPELTFQDLRSASVGDTEPQGDRAWPSLLVENPHGSWPARGIGASRLADWKLVVPSLLIRSQQGTDLAQDIFANAQSGRTALGPRQTLHAEELVTPFFQDGVQSLLLAIGESELACELLSGLLDGLDAGRADRIVLP